MAEFLQNELHEGNVILLKVNQMNKLHNPLSNSYWSIKKVEWHGQNN